MITRAEAQHEAAMTRTPREEPELMHAGGIIDVTWRGDHFPTDDDLIEAVESTIIEQVTAEKFYTRFVRLTVHVENVDWREEINAALIHLEREVELCGFKVCLVFDLDLEGIEVHHRRQDQFTFAYTVEAV